MVNKVGCNKYNNDDERRFGKSYTEITCVYQSCWLLSGILRYQVDFQVFDSALDGFDEFNLDDY